MTNTEFIELLNLYLDHELSAADAARLEAEVIANPAHRRTYEQYCRMQNACKALAADFVAEAPAASTERILAFESGVSRRSPAGLFAVGSLAAAAACAAFLLIGRGGQPAGNDLSVAVTQTPSAPVAAETVADSAPRANGIVQRSSLMGDSIFLTGLNAQATESAVAPQLAWIQGVHLTPMQQVVAAEQLRFDAQLKSRPEARTLGTAQKAGTSVSERSAFEFRP